MMAIRGRQARYTTAQAINVVLQSEEHSNLEDSDITDAESDHISEPSDHSDTESAEPVPHAQDDSKPDVLPQIDQARGRKHGRGRGGGCGRGSGRGQGQAAATHQPDPAQIALVGRNGTMWQRNAPNIGRRRIQDIIRQPPGITNAAHSTQQVV